MRELISTLKKKAHSGKKKIVKPIPPSPPPKKKKNPRKREKSHHTTTLEGIGLPIARAAAANQSVTNSIPLEKPEE